MRKKKVLAAILAMAMTLSMAGCGSDAQTGLSSETKSVTSETTESNTEKVKLSVFIPQGSDVVDINENQVFLDLKQATGYDIDLILVPSDDATEKLNLLLASGEYPDVIMGSYFSNQDLEKVWSGRKNIHSA